MNERQLISHLRKRIEKPEHLLNWLDDDCEIIDRGDYFQLITIDTSSEKADFPSDAPPFAIGYFSTALSLSDIAACGGTPDGILVSCSVSPAFDHKIIEIYEGIIQAATDSQTQLLGGDSNSAGEFSLSVVALGKVNKDKVLRRGGAKIGDVIGVTGTLDKFNFGHYQYSKGIPINYERMLKQSARINEGKALASIGGITSCIDLPDGLSKALYDTLPKNMGVSIQDKLIPVPTFREASLDMTLTNFELASRPAGDIELLFTASTSEAVRIYKEFQTRGLKLTWIGQVTDKPGIQLRFDNKIVSQEVEGFVHKFEGYQLFP